MTENARTVVKRNAIYEMTAVKLGLSTKQVHEIMGVFWDTVRHEIVQGNDVDLTGLMLFKHRERGEREARNPRTGESVHVDARTVLKIIGRSKFDLNYNIGKDIRELELTDEQEARLAAIRERYGI